MSKQVRKRRQGIALMLIGLVCLSAAFGFVINNRNEALAAEQSSLEALGQVKERIAANTIAAGGGDEEKEMPFVTIDGLDYIGTLEIPALDIALPVLRELSYPGLRIAPSLYTGSYMEGNMIIAGHNYASHFGGLQRLNAGDAVRFTDASGGVHEYEISIIETLGGTDVERMQEGSWDLTLFTCTYGGRQRVTVRCVSLEENFTL